MNEAQVFETMFKLCAAMLAGFGMKKAKILSDETNAGLSGMIITVTCPALIIYSVCKQTEVNLDVVKLVGVGAIIYALLLPILAIAMVRYLIRPEKEMHGTYQLLLVFANVTFMGFPVAQALYGERAIFYMNIFNIPFSLLIFTYGVRLVQAGGEQQAKFKLRDILSPGFLSGILSLLIYFLQIRLPTVLVSTLGFVGNITTPLSMIVIGSMIGNFSFSTMFKERKLFLLSLIKLVVFPALGFLFARTIFKDPMLAGIITISLGMPCASLSAMVSNQYGNEKQADIAALGVFISTLLSIATIPIMLALIA